MFLFRNLNKVLKDSLHFGWFQKKKKMKTNVGQWLAKLSLAFGSDKPIPYKSYMFPTVNIV